MRVRTLYSRLLIGVLTLGCFPQAFPPDSPHPELAARFVVAAYGDSLTRDAAGETWMTHLPEAWGHIVRAVVDEGSTLGTQRLERDLDSGLLSSIEDVEVVVLLWGTNDVDRPGWLDLPEGVTAADYYADQVVNHGLDPELAADYAAAAMSATDLRNRMFAVIARARELGIDVVLAAPPPLADPTSIFNQRLDALRYVLCNAAIQASVACVDLFQAFSSHEGGPASLLDADGMHLGASGRLLVAGLIGAAIQPYFDAWPPPTP